MNPGQSDERGIMVPRIRGDDPQWWIELAARTGMALEEWRDQTIREQVKCEIALNNRIIEISAINAAIDMSNGGVAAVSEEELKRRVRILVRRGRIVGLARNVCHFCAKESASESGLKKHLIRTHKQQIAALEASFFE